jgi:hypothetical protein
MANMFQKFFLSRGVILSALSVAVLSGFLGNIVGFLPTGLTGFSFGGVTLASVLVIWLGIGIGMWIDSVWRR